MRMTYGTPVIRIQSPTWMEAAWTRTSTSFSPISGLPISCAARTSAEPYLSWTIAFMLGRLPLLLYYVRASSTMYTVVSTAYAVKP